MNRSHHHGFTGQTLILSPDEHEAYQAHVAGFFAEYQPKGQVEINLTQQLADIHFSLNQIFVQQANMMGLINAISLQMASEGPIAAAGALAPHIRSLIFTTNAAAAPPKTSRSASEPFKRNTATRNAPNSPAPPNTISYSKRKEKPGFPPIRGSFVL